MKALDIILPAAIIVLCVLAIRRARKKGGCCGKCDGCRCDCGRKKE